jgi:DNA replicative helicase MCM subunit Mcm2 (Cdc46/Mcm family)
VLVRSFNITAQTQNNSATLTGVVTDEVTGETLPGATVVIVGTYSGANADENGKYVITTDEQVEKEYEKVPKKGSKKREIVIALMNTMMTEEEKSIFEPLLEGLIDVSIGLMNQPKLLGVKSRFLCG